MCRNTCNDQTIWRIYPFFFLRIPRFWNYVRHSLNPPIPPPGMAASYDLLSFWGPASAWLSICRSKIYPPERKTISFFLSISYSPQISSFCRLSFSALSHSNPIRRDIRIIERWFPSGCNPTAIHGTHSVSLRLNAGNNRDGMTNIEWINLIARGGIEV